VIKQLDKKYSIKSLHKAVEILKSFSIESSSLTLTELHELTGISKPGLQRILTTLVFEGFLQKDEKSKRYHLGLELYFLGTLVKKESNILNAALPVMEKIRDETGEAVTLNTIYENKRRCIGSCESRKTLSALTLVGHDSPLYAGASAKILLAYLSEHEINEYINLIELEKITPKTITDKQKLKEELSKINSQGYAISLGERVKGTFSLSAPIFYPSNQVAAGVSIVIPTARIEEFDLEELILLLLTRSREIAESINHRELVSRQF
jgi:IclR family KDG regulon transcriptional repressor